MAKASRGEIWLIDLGMAQKNRPGVILSVEYLDDHFDPGAFDAQGIGGVPDVRLIRRLGFLQGAKLTEVENTVRAWLAL